MFYVKHLTHAHFVRGRTDRYIIYNWGERSEALHGRYILDFSYIIIIIIIIIIYYRRTSNHSNFALAALCA